AGWSTEEWTALFPVFVDGGESPSPGRPPMLGSYQIAKGTVRFVPRFPLEPGLPYRARFDPSRLPGRDRTARRIETVLSIPRPSRRPSTRVEKVYPTRSVLPENQLKFYLHFSAPMSRGGVYQHIHVLGPTGKAVDMPFLELDEELWDARGVRLTLLFDPGR